MPETPVPAAFVRDLAHDLVNPLSSMLGFLDLLLSPAAKDPLTHRQRRMLAAITRSATHLLGMMRDLAELSKAEEADAAPQRSPVDLGAAAREVFGRYKLLSDLRRISVSTHAAPGTPAALADPRWIDVFLDALLRAAGRRTHEGGAITLHLEGHGADVAGRLEHTGDLYFPGADEPALAGTLSGPRPSDGYASLGLALLRHLARLQDGDLDVLPKSGGGSLFRFRFPAAP